MANTMLPEYVAFAHKRTRAYLVFAAVAAALPILGLCYISGMVWSRQIVANAADVVAAQRQTLGRPAFGAVSLAAAGASSSASNNCQPVMKLIPPPKTRQDIAQLLEHEGFEVGALLGVGQGVFTAETLFLWRSCKRIYLVDPYSTQQQPATATLVPNAADKQRQQQLDLQEESMQQAHENLQAWREKLLWMRNTTTVAARHIREPLDYVYLDARRDYCSVLEALEAWWPLVRPGGVLAGHSYENAVDVMRQSGQDWSICADGSTVHQGAVQAAVNDFFGQQGVQIVVTYREHEYNSWLVRKPYYPCSDHEAAGAAVLRERHEPLTELLSKMLQQAPQQPGQLQQLETAQRQEQQQQAAGQLLQEQQQEEQGALLVHPQQIADGAGVLPLSDSSALDGQQQMQQQQREAATQQRLQQQHQQEQQQAALMKLHDSQALASSRAHHIADEEPARTAKQAGSSRRSGGRSGDVFGDILSAQHHDLDR